MARMTERAQSLLVGAVFMAVIFVSLALLLNSSLYGTTIASDASADVTGGDGAVLRDAIRDDVGYLIEDAIEKRSTSGAQETYVENRVVDLSPRYRGYYAQYDRIVDVSYASSNGGTRIGKSSGDFTHNANEDWVVSSTTRVRDFSITVNGASSTSPYFTVRFDGSDDLQIYESGSDVVVRGPDGETCTASASDPTIFFANATIDGDPCPPLDFVSEYDSPYRVEFVASHQIAGSYSLIAQGSATGHNDESVIYSTTVDLWERTPENKYNAQIRVAPGEPR